VIGDRERTGSLDALFCTPTPLHRADRLATALGVRELWIKRDDLIGPGLGGNKARKLRGLLDDARAQGADHVVTVGAAQSNHARMTAILGAICGIEVHLVLGGSRARQGNVMLDAAAGAHIHWCPSDEWDALDEMAAQLLGELRAEGLTAVAIPLGGSNAIGAEAFRAAYDELGAQLDALSVAVDCIIHASSSGGTQAGLVAGYIAGGRSGPRVIGVDVAKGELDLAKRVPALAATVLSGAAAPREEDEDVVICDPVGLPYGAPAAEIDETIRTAMRTVGLVCDPVYSGRALLGLRRLAAELPPTVVFWHTGGIPAIFAQPYSTRLAWPGTRNATARG
jgi:L-cysteate sulfo-lyase